jgi:hypothetical protein
VVLFHVVDAKTELNFDFDNAPRKFIDVETGEELSVYADNVKEEYENKQLCTSKVAMTCSEQN